ncbi:hypothetical protein M885DRAFT_551818 [Pelagophyceae sp. CCMP2097]|nr:hypothetical protein M885DRAFT_551818 [Pelagophyceae sp. CCMP2097]
MAFSMTEVAYTKLALHAAKYPHCAVDGLLLGSTVKQAGGLEVTVLDAVPLFHNGTLAPLLEAATTMADAHAMQLGAHIVGYYFANEHLEDESAPATTSSIAEAIEAALGAPACILQLSNKRLANPGDAALVARTRQGELKVDLKPASAATAFLDAQAAGVDVFDFDAHFDDVTLDWRNAQVATWLAARKA